MSPTWSLRPAVPEDAGWMADLKAVAMRPDLERLGYWDEEWAKGRFLDSYVPANTSVVLQVGNVAGCIAVRSEPEAYWLEHFYLYPWAQGRGLGGEVLAYVLALPREPKRFLLSIDRGSSVVRLYERHGFVHLWDDDNGVDQIFGREPDLGAADPGGSAELAQPRQHGAGAVRDGHRVVAEDRQQDVAHPHGGVCLDPRLERARVVGADG